MLSALILLMIDTYECTGCFAPIIVVNIRAILPWFELAVDLLNQLIFECFDERNGASSLALLCRRLGQLSLLDEKSVRLNYLWQLECWHLMNATQREIFKHLPELVHSLGARWIIVVLDLFFFHRKQDKRRNNLRELTISHLAQSLRSHQLNRSVRQIKSLHTYRERKHDGKVWRGRCTGQFLREHLYLIFKVDPLIKVVLLLVSYWFAWEAARAL